MYKKIIIYIIFISLNISYSFSEIIKPNNRIDPVKVVKIQLSGLMNNDNPIKNHGIKQTWEFAHPSNKKYTGPLPRFIEMIKSESYQMLLKKILNQPLFMILNW